MKKAFIEHDFPVKEVSEQSARENARRSLVAARDIAAGKVIEYEDLTWKRPASGISPNSTLRQPRRLIRRMYAPSH